MTLPHFKTAIRAGVSLLLARAEIKAVLFRGMRICSLRRHIMDHQLECLRTPFFHYAYDELAWVRRFGSNALAYCQLRATCRLEVLDCVAQRWATSAMDDVSRAVILEVH